MKDSMSADSVLRDRDRMAAYKILAVAFSYPEKSFPMVFPRYAETMETVQFEYDRLFRAGTVWLYGAEYMVESEFQRAALLADIMGFYKAFGVEPDKDRPDALSCELEFMHYLIVKKRRLTGQARVKHPEEKIVVCREAEKKFFAEHLAPAGKIIAEKILAASAHPFYREAASALTAFLSEERNHLKKAAA